MTLRKHRMAGTRVEADDCVCFKDGESCKNETC